jgi:hypothetical protein
MLERRFTMRVARKAPPFVPGQSKERTRSAAAITLVGRLAMRGTDSHSPVHQRVGAYERRA